MNRAFMGVSGSVVGRGEHSAVATPAREGKSRQALLRHRPHGGLRRNDRRDRTKTAAARVGEFGQTADFHLVAGAADRNDQRCLFTMPLSIRVSEFAAGPAPQKAPWSAGRRLRAVLILSPGALSFNFSLSQ